MELPTALLTIIGSGVVAAAVTYLLNSNKEQVFFMRKKAEDLFICADQFATDFVSSHMMAFPLFKGEIKYNDFLDHYISDGKSREGSSGKSARDMNMLTQIYFVQLMPLLQEWEKRRAIVNKVMQDHKREYKRGGTDPAEDVPRLQAALMHEGKAAEAFIAGVVAEGQKLAASDVLWPESVRLMRSRSSRLVRNALAKAKKLRNR